MADRPENRPEDVLEGVLLRVLFRSEDDAFTVASLRPARGAEVRVVGALGGLHEGEQVRLRGQWRHTERFGHQFQVHVGYPILPQDPEGIRRYLASGRVKGVGKGLAERLVAAFGHETLRVVAEDPVLLATVPGIGPKRSQELVAAFRAQRDQREALVFLQGAGLPAALARRVWERHGDATIARVRANPYRLVEEIRGVGFRTADAMAAGLGFAPDSPARAAAGLAYLLASAADDGHVYLPRAALLDEAARLLGTDAVAGEVLDQLLADGRLIDGGLERIYLRGAYQTEEEAAARTEALVAAQTPPLGGDPEAAARGLGLTLAPAQLEALRLATEVPFMVLTGGPGTGKTTIIRVLLALLAAAEGRVILAAPTGRAARRMAEATGQEARTLHRLLEFSPGEGGFRRDAERPLEAQAIIVDEASMIDQPLYLALLRAVSPGTRLILVGDADQLPSVGPGQVLADLLAVEAVPAVRLTEIFRQAQQSRIVLAAHAVLHGQVPIIQEAETLGDFFIVPARSAEEAAALVERTVAERIPAAFGLDPARDVQVLTPMHRGRCGAAALNERLQGRQNPGEPLIRQGERAFRAGDKVMQIRNDYEKEVFNGEIGWVLGLDGQGLRVRFEERELVFDRTGLDALTLAWACTVHKSQGSEYPAVVLPVVREHRVMLQRGLLYTGLTRGRRLVVLVAEEAALGYAVRSVSAMQRFTGLAGRLGGQREQPAAGRWQR
ncbi:MAG: ATP-dependent RecD-like DNA helicase [Myxococcales bacterium]|nr:ATP-dependent RecD-like DNA helicase [Myxococcales bacterium]